MLLGHLLTVLFLDHINHVVTLRLLSRGANLLSNWPRDSLALLHWPAAALLLSPRLSLGDGPGVAHWFGDSAALLGSDSVIGGLAMRGSGNPLFNCNRSNTNGAMSISSMDAVAGIGLSQGKGETKARRTTNCFMISCFLDFPRWLIELKCRIQVSILLLYFV